MQNIPHKLFCHPYLLYFQVQKVEKLNSSIYIQNENSLSFISHRKMDWSSLSICFYEVQNDKTLLLTL